MAISEEEMVDVPLSQPCRHDATSQSDADSGVFTDYWYINAAEADILAETTVLARWTVDYSPLSPLKPGQDKADEHEILLPFSQRRHLSAPDLKEQFCFSRSTDKHAVPDEQRSLRYKRLRRLSWSQSVFPSFLPNHQLEAFSYNQEPDVAANHAYNRSTPFAPVVFSTTCQTHLFLLFRQPLLK
jgi:hypothetical protein